jgi:hypothetical protein
MSYDSRKAYFYVLSIESLNFFSCWKESLEDEPIESCFFEWRAMMYYRSSPLVQCLKAILIKLSSMLGFSLNILTRSELNQGGSKAITSSMI